LSRAEPPTPAFEAGIRDSWLLETGIAFLNHGSFGAAPREVLEEQLAWRERLERQPVHFMDGEYPGLVREAAAELAGFLGADPEGLALVDNASTGVNAVLRSLDLGPGDDLLTTTHAYGAVRKTLDYLCDRSGARLVEAPVPFPLKGPEEVVEAVAGALGPRTRVAVLDHVSSPTALVFPIAELVALCRERGVPVLVDGAHAPGMLPLFLEELGADWYTGNCHKWLCAPKGCGFLVAAPPAREGIHPTVISHGYGSGFLAEFDWTGTRDPSPWLALPSALAFHRRLGPEKVREHNRQLAVWARELLAEAWEVRPPAPEGMLGAMATLPLPEAWRKPATEKAARELHDHLWEKHRIEVPVLLFEGRLWLRVSAQVYNRPEEYRLLAAALSRRDRP
jgi:isopenicillin-N epimerase